MTDGDLSKVERRRRFPTAVTQAGQRLAQRRIVDPLLHATGPVNVPRPVRLVDRTPRLQQLAARVVGLGVRPEHVGPIGR
ncbi:hypothetical protein O7635_10430 [Asanoa sp. WMMD1127]|nr:hypothetical protein [Asanoa sp. WMMD1127]MDG4822266.1 hypothetical protein [Asanoa sp. WMMD1127]